MKKLALILLVAIFLPGTSAFSVKMTSLYQTEIPVISQSSETKEQAVRDGFLQVLIKVSGNAQVDKNPLIRAGLKRADYYVHDYSYLSETPDSSQYLLQIVYEAKDVKKLLQNAKVSYWGDNRPLILVWVVAPNKHHGPDIVSDGGRGSVYTSIRGQSKKYGLPLIFPTMDVEEMNHVSPTDVSEISMDVLNEASKPYAPDAQLIGQISENEQGVMSQWQLIVKDDQWGWEINDKTVDAVISSIMSKVNQALMRHFGVKNA